MTGSIGDRSVRMSYIVHVYRHGDRPGHEVSGLVEPVEGGDPSPFAGRDELWAVLAGGSSSSRAGRRRQQRDS